MKNIRNNQKNVNKNVKVVIVLTIFHNVRKFGMSYNSCRLLSSEMFVTTYWLSVFYLFNV